LTQEKAAHQTAEQSLQTSDEARVNLVWDLESV
jgi:chromosome segregation ATPase